MCAYNRPPPAKTSKHGMRRQSEREMEDSRILEEALAALAVQHEARLSVLDLELKKDEDKVRGTFKAERVSHGTFGNRRRCHPFVAHFM